MLKIPAFHYPSLPSGKLGDVGDGGRLRCLPDKGLPDKADTTISHAYTCTVGSTECSIPVFINSFV